MLMLENACLDPGDITIFGGEYNVLQSEPPSRYVCVGVYVCLLSYAHYGLLKACRWSVIGSGALTGTRPDFSVVIQIQMSSSFSKGPSG